jgi:hypothetical protein
MAQSPLKKWTTRAFFARSQSIVEAMMETAETALVKGYLPYCFYDKEECH